ncbi:autotransporter domain-containing protein [Devosia sp.]|uniref:autotransporter outer membrane beta-barrel domain-containing protein n=1 Tax=Devosia sp. TaxID=1871048 RepID=UPI0025F4C34F|nr:autotransporter domain-containing protein [Devosia sp.]MCR6636409.1 autotransporter domain-containing protein [Devosia sp.]
MNDENAGAIAAAGLRVVRKKRTARTLLATCSLLALTSAVQAQNFWVGTQSQDWFDPLNWTLGVPDVNAPGLDDNINILTDAPNSVVLSGGVASSNILSLGGAPGTGILEINGGGVLTSFDGILGRDPGYRGVVRVDGAASRWHLANEAIVGFSGDGWLDIASGATVTADELIAGFHSASDGSITIGGSGARLTVTNGLTVGMDGGGRLEIRANGVVNSLAGSLGGNATSTAFAHISGLGAQWNNTADLRVGIRGNGEMTILGGGSVSSSDGAIGYDAGAGIVEVANSGRWTNTGALLVGAAGTGTLTVASDGVVAANTVTIAQQPGSAGTINIGSKLGDPAAWAGMLDTPALVFGAGTATLNFNHIDTALDFDTVMSGAGAINHVAGTTIFSENSSAFTGTTAVSGGTLAVGNALGGVVNVFSAGTLAGSGTLGTLNAGAGGTVAPGNSIGTLSATNVSFGAGSFYDVEVNAAGASDRILATGTATLSGGTVRVSASPDYASNTRYTILTAAGGVSGAFGGASTNLAFLTPLLSYDATNAFMTLVQGANFASAARTPNQLAVAGATDALGAGNALYNALLPLTPDEARRAMDDLSGEGHASLSSMFIEDAAMLRQTALDHARHDPDQAIGSMALGYASTPVLADTPETFAVWAQAAGSQSRLAADGNAAQADGASGGLAFGADGVAGDWRVGMMLHAGATGLSIADRSMTANSTNYGLGAYAGTAWGDTNLSLGLGYTRHQVRSSRSVAFGGLANTLSADYGASTAQVFGELSHHLDLGAFELTPYGEVAYVINSTDGFAEAGGPAALNVASAVQQGAFTTIGARAGTTVPVGDGGQIALEAGLGWRHAFVDQSGLSNTFGVGPAFAIAGAPVQRDALVLEAAGSIDLSANAALGLSYDGQIGTAGQTHMLKATLGGSF